MANSLRLLSRIEDELSCPICLGRLQNPVITIYCRHAFCRRVCDIIVVPFPHAMRAGGHSSVRPLRVPHQRGLIANVAACVLLLLMMMMMMMMMMMLMLMLLLLLLLVEPADLADASLAIRQCILEALRVSKKRCPLCMEPCTRRQLSEECGHLNQMLSTVLALKAAVMACVPCRVSSSLVVSPACARLVDRRPALRDGSLLLYCWRRRWSLARSLARSSLRSTAPSRPRWSLRLFVWFCSR